MNRILGLIILVSPIQPHAVHPVVALLVQFFVAVQVLIPLSLHLVVPLLGGGLCRGALLLVLKMEL